jgi:hypothetical protein
MASLFSWEWECLCLLCFALLCGKFVPSFRYPVEEKQVPQLDMAWVTKFHVRLTSVSLPLNSSLLLRNYRGNLVVLASIPPISTPTAPSPSCLSLPPRSSIVFAFFDGAFPQVRFMRQSMCLWLSEMSTLHVQFPCSSQRDSLAHKMLLPNPPPDPHDPILVHNALSSRCSPQLYLPCRSPSLSSPLHLPLYSRKPTPTHEATA